MSGRAWVLSVVAVCLMLALVLVEGQFTRLLQDYLSAFTGR